MYTIHIRLRIVRTLPTVSFPPKPPLLLAMTQTGYNSSLASRATKVMPEHPFSLNTTWTTPKAILHSIHSRKHPAVCTNQTTFATALIISPTLIASQMIANNNQTTSPLRSDLLQNMRRPTSCIWKPTTECKAAVKLQILDSQLTILMRQFRRKWCLCRAWRRFSLLTGICKAPGVVAAYIS